MRKYECDREGDRWVVVVEVVKHINQGWIERV